MLDYYIVLFTVINGFPFSVEYIDQVIVSIIQDISLKLHASGLNWFS